MSDASEDSPIPSERVFAFAGQDLLVGVDGIAIPGSELQKLPPLRGRDFTWNGRFYKALAFDGTGTEAAIARGLKRLPLRQALAESEPEELRAALKGMALLNWLSGARHCGGCGALLAEPGPEEEAHASGGMVCPSCGRAHFPRISPAVIVLVKKGGKALLARNARFPPGRFGLLAGFVEPGESLEEAAAREVKEEAGIEITALRYRYSQPWPFPDSLMLAFEAEWAGGEAKPDGAEIAELLWCGPDELPQVPPPGSVARRLIDDFVASSRH